MIYITGDLHESVMSRFSRDNFPDIQKLTADDYIIVLGDFGRIWNYDGENESEKRELDWLNRQAFTTLFIDGNHENFDRLSEYKTKKWNGGLVHEIRANIFHLMRGFVFQIDGKKFFTFGGGKSQYTEGDILDPLLDIGIILKNYKNHGPGQYINHMNWWKEELPDRGEMLRGIDNLSKNHYRVDYVLTHSPPSAFLDLIDKSKYEYDILTEYLDKEVRRKITYDRWFCAHLHLSRVLNDKDFVIYKEIIRIV